MDTNVWGPKLWNIIYDVCYRLDITPASPEVRRATALFLKSLKYLLPCKYCRESYTSYVAPDMLDIDRYVFDTKNRHACCAWAHSLKNLVNDKLGRSSEYRLTFDKFMKRMNTWQSASSITDVFDILYILALNYTPDKHQPMHVFLTVLPIVLTLVPKFTETQALFDRPPREEDLTSQDALLRWLCSVASRCNSVECRTVEFAKQKYAFCRAST